MTYSSPRLIALGKFFFRHRSITPLPLLLLIFLCSLLTNESSHSIFLSLIGIVFVVLGETIRMACVKRARSITRTRSAKTGDRLIKVGLFRLSRNPIYIGNFCLGLGIMFFSGLALAPPVFVILFLLQYVPIVAYEESILMQKFGQEYRDYLSLVPRWLGITRLKAIRPADNEFYPFHKVLKSESSTLAAVVALTALMNLHRFIL